MRRLLARLGWRFDGHVWSLMCSLVVADRSRSGRMSGAEGELGRRAGGRPRSRSWTGLRLGAGMLVVRGVCLRSIVVVGRVVLHVMGTAGCIEGVVEVGRESGREGRAWERVCRSILLLTFCK